MHLFKQGERAKRGLIMRKSNWNGRQAEKGKSPV